MPLAKQAIPLLFEGLDTKADSKAGVYTKLDLVENGYVTRKPFELLKRNGFTSLSRTIDGGGSIAAGKKCAAYRDEAVMTDGSWLYTRNSVSSSWAKRGKVPSAWAAIDRLTGDTLLTARADVAGAYAAGVILYVWDDASTGYYSVYDSATGALLASSSVAGMIEPRVLALSGLLFIVYVDGNDGRKLKIRKLDPAAPTVLGAATTIIASIVDRFDAVADTGTPQILVCYHVQGVSGGVVLKTVTTALAVAGGVAINEAGGVSPLAIGWLTHAWNDGKGYLAIVWNGVAVGSFAYDVDTATLASTKTAIDPAITSANAVTGYFTAGTRNVFIERPGASADLNFIRGWSAGVGFELARGLCLASKAFAFGGRYYLAVNYEDTQQRSMFLLEYEHGTNGAGGGTCVAAFLLSGDGGGESRTINSINDPVAISADTFALPWSYSFDKGDHYGIAAPRVHFNEDCVSPPAQFADSLFIPGADLRQYDGAAVVESGFYLTPKTPTLAGAGGGSKSGTVQVCTVYRWTDARGRLWRSPPSVPASIVLGASTAITVTASTLRLTAKDPKFNANQNVPKVVIEAYCTEAGKTVFYLDSTNPNVVTQDTVPITLTQSDASLVANGELLYTSGNVKPNAPAPAVRIARVWANRMFAISGEGELRPSKDLAEGEGVAFPTDFRIGFDTAEGRVTDVFDLDDRLIIGKRMAAYVLSGEGPDDRGGNPYPSPQRLTTDTGPIDPHSAVRTTQGMMVKTAAGIFVSQGGASAAYVGDRVEAYNANTVTGAAAVDGTTHARFVTSEGNVLVYDFVLDRWYVWTGLAAVGCFVWRGAFCILASDGTVKQEVAGSYSDDGAAIVTKWRTAWIPFGGFLSGAKLKKPQVMLTVMSSHTHKITLAYDFDASDNEVFTMAVTAALIGPVTFQPQYERVRAIQLTGEDSFSSPGQGYKLTGLALLCALKGGLKKLAGDHEM